jgi:hypothetical protein
MSFFSIEDEPFGGYPQRLEWRTRQLFLRKRLNLHTQPRIFREEFRVLGRKRYNAIVGYGFKCDIWHEVISL